MNIVILGLSVTSSWGNGHATTYRGLMAALDARGHDVLFLERDVLWYADNRDLRHPPYGRTELYASLDELRDRFTRDVTHADAVIVGSYVPQGVAVGEWVLANARGVTAFYDIDTPVTLAKLAAGDFEYLSPPPIRSRAFATLRKPSAAPSPSALASASCCITPQPIAPPSSSVISLLPVLPSAFVSAMTRFLLIRHARTAVAGVKLTGRMPDIPLTTQGLEQAEELVHRLRTAEIRALYSSPLDRARQTACALSRERRLPIHISPAFGEVHFGDWTGREIASLEHDSVWRQFHADREGTRIPGGELMSEVQDRAVRELHTLAARHPHATIAIFSHADVIRATVCHFLGLRLNHMLKFQIDPCSISVLEMYPDAAQIALLNCVGSIF
ncbi:MAG TPA: hypothetical protein DEQ47_10070 [Solibacterales bacterium]|nr:hypothetical protein [Bryobacterales bacterium]